MPPGIGLKQLLNMEGNGVKKYIALLRGINVGGNNKISMKELKKAFEESGFQAVSTYINSGNIVFSAEDAEIELLKRKSESLIFDKFGLNISAMIISADEVCEALKNAPDWWGVDKESKHNAIFVISPITVEEVYLEVGELKPQYEKVSHFNRIIFWSAPIKSFSRTRWSKVVGSSVYNSVTIRNANTVKTLAKLCYSG